MRRTGSSEQNENRMPMTADEVYQDLLNRIIRLELEPGQPISENTMSAEYGVSRSVIRTAFTRLMQLRFVEILPQRGTFVMPLDCSRISDILMLRTAVEKEVLFEMFTNLNQDTRKDLLKQLDRNMKEQKKYKDEKNYFGKFPSLDSEFHMIMINSVGRASLMSLLHDDFLHLARWRNFDVAMDNRVPQLIGQHQDIVEAIRSENLSLAQQKMAEHLDTITLLGQKAMQRVPQYFRDWNGGKAGS